MSRFLLFCFLATVAICPTTFCAIPPSDSDSLNSTASLPVLQSKRSIIQYGITWTFEKPAPVGQFINGDFYVVGPVTIIAIDPKPLLGSEVPASEIGERDRALAKDGQYIRNGSMLNPPADQKVAFDSGMRSRMYFKPELLARPPIAMAPGDCLVSTISLKVGEKSRFAFHGDGGYRDHHDDSPTKTAAVLTCVAKPQPVDAFRPSYGDRTGTIYLARNLRRDLLLNLPRPKNTPSIQFWADVFRRPWINSCFFGFEQPMENMPHYGQWVGQAQSTGALLLMVDFSPAEKEPLLINMVQVGIDYWGLIKNGHPGWEGFGGHGSGRKFPIVFAGLMLGDAQMASPTKSFPKAQFGEDNQTMYGDGWTGAKALFAGHSGLQNGTPPRPKWGPYEHLPPSRWTQSNLNSESYRRANTSSAWVGQALALHMLHAEVQWNHDAFFDYVERWMAEGDAPFRHELLKYFPKERFGDKDTFTHEGNAGDPFVKSMWDTYHPAFGRRVAAGQVSAK